MWTEHAPQELVESKVYPRLTALSEVYWSGPNRTTQPKAYTDFLARLDAHYVRLDAMDVDYGLESPPFALETAAGANGALSAEVIALGRGVTGRGLWTGSQRQQHHEATKQRSHKVSRIKACLARQDVRNT